MQIRPSTAEDYPSIVSVDQSLNFVWPERPRTPEGWAQVDRNRNLKCEFQRWVADVDGLVVGFGAYGQSSVDYHPQRFYVNVEVRPDYQRRGIGAALYDQVLSALQSFDPRVLRADAFTHLPQGFLFAQKRGFYEAFRETPVHLDVATFQTESNFGLAADLRDRGILIKALCELAYDPDRDRKVYDLYWEVTEDVPQEDTRIEKQGFEEWEKWGLLDPTLLHDAYYVAVCGDEYVALSEWGKDPDSATLLGGLLGVRRAFRRLGLARAMTVRAIEYCAEHGYPVLKTCTAVQNVPMQALFRRLGFARDPEWIQCQKDIVPLR